MTEVGEGRAVGIIGSGILGLATAVYLQRAGFAVTVIDPLPAGGGTSFGNSGLISNDTAVPIAQPGMLRKVPGWLFRSDGPLVIRSGYLPRLAPWLMRWVAASSLRRVMPISDAMRALHSGSLAGWRELLGEADFARLVRLGGQVRIWEGGGMESRIEMAIAQRHGIEVEPLGARDLQRIYPGISPDIQRGMRIPGNAFTVSPIGLVQALLAQFLQAGGQAVHERVLKILPRGPQGFTLMTNIANRCFSPLVVAGGAWSGGLLAPLGIRVPLESERGYHALLPAPNVELPMPLSVKNRGFGLTSMTEGLRVTGTVEFAGLEAAPDERRAAALVGHARRIFPGLAAGAPRYWMGHRPSTPDTLPVLGEAPGHPGLYLAFGHGHFGLTGGPPSAKLVSQLIAGSQPAIDPRPYVITRFGGRGQDEGRKGTEI